MTAHTLHMALGWIITVTLAVTVIRILVQDWQSQFGRRQDQDTNEQ